MGAMNDKDIVQKQYKNATNLNTRISIHDKYSVNKQGFGNWIVSNYQITDGMRVLDKTTPRLLQSHTLGNAVKPPYLGGFFISGVSAA